MDERGQAANLPAKWKLPPDTVIGFARLSASPDGSYLIGIDETEGGDVVYAFNSLTGKLMSTLSAGKFFGWHPKSREILFYQDLTSERGLWLFNIDVDQNGTSNRWLSLGIYQFGSYPSAPWYGVWTDDKTGEAQAGRNQLGVDAVRFRPPWPVYIPVVMKN